MKDLYLALGDSLTAGYEVGLNKAFATNYYGIIKAHRPGVSYINSGVNGLSTAGLAEMLTTSRQTLNNVAQADLITLTIGSNDLLALARCFLRQEIPNIPASLQNISLNLKTIGGTLRSFNRHAHIQIATIYNPLPAGPYYQSSCQTQELITQVNAGLVDWSRAFGCTVVPVDHAFRGKESLLIGPDSIHPNIMGHELMAKTFACHPNLKIEDGKT
ncbi:MAG: SGNH/GDSL hydrolase family protein [Desulfitobacteriaceae bacterium]